MKQTHDKFKGSVCLKLGEELFLEYLHLARKHILIRKSLLRDTHNVQDTIYCTQMYVCFADRCSKQL